MSHIPPNGSGHMNPAVNASGTLLSTARRLMPGDPAVNLANPMQDHCTVITYGKHDITVKTALAMGVLTRSGSTLTENLAFREGNRPHPF